MLSRTFRFLSVSVLAEYPLTIDELPACRRAALRILHTVEPGGRSMSLAGGPERMPRFIGDRDLNIDVPASAVQEGQSRVILTTVVPASETPARLEIDTFDHRPVASGLPVNGAEVLAPVRLGDLMAPDTQCQKIPGHLGPFRSNYIDRTIVGYPDTSGPRGFIVNVWAASLDACERMKEVARGIRLESP